MILQHSVPITSDEDVEKFVKRVVNWLVLYKPNRVVVDIQSELLVPLMAVYTLDDVVSVSKNLVLHSMLNLHFWAVISVYHQDVSFEQITEKLEVTGEK